MEKDRPAHFLSSKWTKLHEQKGDLIDRCEAYARWTVPYVCLPDNVDGWEANQGSVDKGAKMVNHLANRIVDVLFPTSRSFFNVTLNAETQLKISQEQGEENLPAILEEVTQSMNKLEKIALAKMNLTAYRPVAIEACKHLIITGNAIIRRMDDGKRVLYGIKRHVIERDQKGNEKLVILFDKKSPKASARSSKTKANSNCTLATSAKDSAGRYIKKFSASRSENRSS